MRRGAAGDLVALHVPGLLRGGVGVDEGAGRGQHRLLAVDHLVHEALLLGLGGEVLLALEEYVQQRVGDAQQPDGAGHAAARGKQAQGGLGAADLGALRVERDAVVAGERDLETAAERGPVDRRDDRLAEGLDAAQIALDLHAALEDLLGVLGAGADEVVEVAAREEGLLGGGDDHAADVACFVLALQAVGDDAQRLLERGVHGVGGLVGVVQYERDDSGVVLLPADGRGLGHGGFSLRT
jgi:hypothetical protein